MTTLQQTQRPVGDLLRQWRRHRRLSQLELATQAAVSTRHLSFVETGRALPSRDLTLLLAEHLILPLRERNQLLLSAGYAPVYSETTLEAPAMSAVRTAVHQVLSGHEPYPAVVIDRAWNLVEANSSLTLFTQGLPEVLLTAPVNVLRASLHPDGMASRIVNLGEWRAHLLTRIHRQATVTGDPALGELYEELRAYPCSQPEPAVETPGPGDVATPLRLHHEDGELAFVSTVATFGTPLDVTVAELAIESFFPADAHTASVLNQRYTPAPATGP